MDITGTAVCQYYTNANGFKSSPHDIEDMSEKFPFLDEQSSRKPGQPVYDAPGNQLGRIQGVTERGFEVDVCATTDVGLEQDP